MLLSLVQQALHRGPRVATGVGNTVVNQPGAASSAERTKLPDGVGPSVALERSRTPPGYLQSVPRVSYISFLDIWMLTSMIFVFSCILEFILVTCFNRTGHKRNGEKVRNTM